MSLQLEAQTLVVDTRGLGRREPGEGGGGEGWPHCSPHPWRCRGAGTLSVWCSRCELHGGRDVGVAMISWHNPNTCL